MNNVVTETRPALAETLFMTTVAVNAIETLAKTARSSGGIAVFRARKPSKKLEISMTPCKFQAL